VARILRGDVVWAELNPAVGNERAGVRPVIVLSHDVFNERSGTVIAIAVTSKEPRASFPLTLEITSTKLPKRSWAKMGQVRTLSVARLGRKLGHLSPEELDRIVEGLNEIVGA
jgi:Growth inhibitor